MLLIVILDFVYSFKPSTFGIPENVQRLNVSQMSMEGIWFDEIRDDPYEVQWWPLISAAGNSLTTPPLDFNEIWVIGVKDNSHGKFFIYFQDLMEEFDEEIEEDKRELVIVFHYKSQVMIHSKITITTYERGIINCLYFLPPAPTETESMTESITEIITNTYDKTVIESKTETATESITKSETTETVINTQELKETEMIINTEIISESVINTQEFQERSINIFMLCALVPLSVIILLCLLLVYLYKKHKTVTNEEINENSDYSVGL